MGILAAAAPEAAGAAGATGSAATGAGLAGTAGATGSALGSSAATGALGAGEAGGALTGTAGATGTAGLTSGSGLAEAFQVMSELKKRGLLSSGGSRGGSGLNSKVDLVPMQFSPIPQVKSNAQDFINAMLARR